MAERRPRDLAQTIVRIFYGVTSTDPFRLIESLASIAATLLLTIAGVTALLGWPVAPQAYICGSHHTAIWLVPERMATVGSMISALG